MSSGKRVAQPVAPAPASAAPTPECIVVRDPTILTFYKENPNLDFVAMNHAFIEILKKLSINLNETIVTNLHSTLLQNIAQLNTQFAGLKQDIQNSETALLLKLAEHQRNISDDIKMVFSNATLSQYEKIEMCINKCKLDLTASVRQMMVENNAQTGEQFLKSVEMRLGEQQKAVLAELASLRATNSKPDTTTQDLIQYMNTQFQHLLQTVPSIVQNILQASETRTTQSMDAIKEKMAVQQSSQNAMVEQMNAFLNRYKHNSSSKGQISENELFAVLQTLFPCDEILDTHAETAACDYRLNRRDATRPTILFENKDYTRPVSKDEVKKFERDVASQKQHGIFISQKSGISMKENFQIDVTDGHIHLYLTHLNYDKERIQVAVAVIDHLHAALGLGKATNCGDEAGCDGAGLCGGKPPMTFLLSSDDMNKIVDEYRAFQMQRDGLVEHLQQSHQTALQLIEKMTMNNIYQVLVKHGLVKADDVLKCLYCPFIGKNKAGTAQHIKRHCKSTTNPYTLERVRQGETVSSGVAGSSDAHPTPTI